MLSLILEGTLKLKNLITSIDCKCTILQRSEEALFILYCTDWCIGDKHQLVYIL